MAGEPFTIAALYNVTDVDGTPTVTYTMVTRAAIGQAETVHPRMPLIVPEAARESWLNPAETGDAGLLAATVAASEEPANAIAITGS